jgi:hypothetical protein
LLKLDPKDFYTTGWRDFLRLERDEAAEAGPISGGR